MPSPPTPFFMAGPCEDLDYQSVRDLPHCTDYKRFVESLWARCHQLVDTNCRPDARKHFRQRFWELYLAVTLLEQGFELRRQGDVGPEFYALVGNRRVWFEAIAPGPGDGPDHVPQPVLHKAFHVPDEKILLRFTNALSEKRGQYTTALTKGIISAEDRYVLAINSRGIPHATLGTTLPYFIQAFLPFGPFTFTVDMNTLEKKDSYFSYRPEVSKRSGSTVSTRPFLDDEASFCSAVLHSGVDCANHPGQLGRDFSILHNPRAQCPLDGTGFGWCEQFTFRDDQLHRSPPLNIP
jgi:hypothetical protein